MDARQRLPPHAGADRHPHRDRAARPAQGDLELGSRDLAAVRALIEHENARGIPCARIFLAGFSQGGAVAYTSALTHPERLAGVIALWISGFKVKRWLAGLMPVVIIPLGASLVVAVNTDASVKRLGKGDDRP